MATVKEMKATARPKAGKGAARAVRRAGRVPGVIYGDNKDPLAISLDHAELKQRIYAGHFLTTIYELDVDGTKHRVIPRDFQLDPVKDLPVHVDFLRLGEGAKIRVRIPVHVMNAEQCAGRQARRHRQHRHPRDRGALLGRGHSGIDRRRRLRPRDQLFEAPERHHAAAERARGGQGRPDAGHHRAAVGLRRRNEGGCRSGCCRCGCCALRLPARRRKALHRRCAGRRSWRRTAAAAPAAGGGDKK